MPKLRVAKIKGFTVSLFWSHYIFTAHAVSVSVGQVLCAQSVALWRLHKVAFKLLGVPPTSALLQHMLSCGEMFTRPYRARMKVRVLRLRPYGLGLRLSGVDISLPKSTISISTFQVPITIWISTLRLKMHFAQHNCTNTQWTVHKSK